MVKDKFFLELMDPFMVADDFRPLPQGLRHAQQIDVDMREVFLLIREPKRCGQRWPECCAGESECFCKG